MYPTTRHNKEHLLEKIVAQMAKRDRKTGLWFSHCPACGSRLIGDDKPFGLKWNLSYPHRTECTEIDAYFHSLYAKRKLSRWNLLVEWLREGLDILIRN